VHVHARQVHRHAIARRRSVQICETPASARTSIAICSSGKSSNLRPSLTARPPPPAAERLQHGLHDARMIVRPCLRHFPGGHLPRIDMRALAQLAVDFRDLLPQRHRRIFK
jgi:hypothetical protein